MLHAEYAHAHPTSGMRSLCIVIVIVLVIAAAGPGLKPISDRLARVAPNQMD